MVDFYYKKQEPVLGSIKRLQGHPFNAPFVIHTTPMAIQDLSKFAERNARGQRWMEALSQPLPCALSYGTANGNADLLSRLPEPLTETYPSGACSLTNLDDIGTYVIGAVSFDLEMTSRHELRRYKLGRRRDRKDGMLAMRGLRFRRI